MGNLSLKTVAGSQANNYVSSNEADNQLDLAATEFRTVAVTADVNWNDGSDAQVATSNIYKALRSSIIEFTGVQAAARTFTVPNNKKWYYVQNSCTGGFNTTFKNTSGAGIAIANGVKKKLFCDGTDIRDWTGI